MKIYGTSGTGGKILGGLMIPWVLLMLPQCHHMDLSDVGAWLSAPLAVGVAYGGRALNLYLANKSSPTPVTRK
jgi:hypothetical protein